MPHCPPFCSRDRADPFKMTGKRVLALVAQAFLWTGSQIPVYILGGVPPYIYADIGGVDRWIWFVLAYLLALAAICPFVGSISDLIGRRWVALGGSTLLVIAMIICGVAKNMNVFIGEILPCPQSGSRTQPNHVEYSGHDLFWCRCRNL